ncbi:PREDICTED: progesterone receptor-like [Nanorana parkeri]|uniref:progesterone receptor-like n=1 Tax=Nanorana parkeri TaxID=125878 RepID=UPI0008542942|nr:PREDICTED: progesterone receptor-like [Nanorana parkeri]
MDEKTKQYSTVPRFPEMESNDYTGSHGSNQVDFLEEMADPEDISLDSLIFQRPEDEVSYQKRGGGPGSCDNNELENVLDSILDTSSSSHLHPWADYVIPELQQISLTPATSTKTLSDPTADKEEAGVWTGATAAEKKSIPTFVPKEQDKATLEYTREDPLEGKGGSHGLLTSRHLLMPVDENQSSMPMLPGSTMYLPAQTRRIEDNDGSEQRSPPSSSQHLSPYPGHSSCSHHDGKVKQEDSEDSLIKPPEQSTLYRNYGLPSPLGTDQSLEYMCKTEAATTYENFRSALGKSSDNTIHVLPTSSTTSQNHHQPLSLNGHQQIAFQSGTVKDTFVPQIHIPYVQYCRPDDPDQSSQYDFDALPQKICLICSDEASGCHYGVLTCGSCKVFFKRAIEGQHNYLCAGRNDCIVDKIRRKNCPSCRLRKCCQAGMVLGGRKFKKFNRLKPGREPDRTVMQQPSTTSVECQSLTRRTSTSSTQEIQYFPELLQILQSIEPEVVYAGYDNTKPETPSALLCSLNQLCERQLLCVVKWSKSLPGFRNLHIDDQIILLQYSWMSLMVFAMGWRSYKHVSGQMLYFAPDLILNEQRMKESSFYSLCVSMRQLPQEFVKLQVSQEEFLCMKALLLLNTIPLEGLKSQSHFDEMRSNYIRELAKAINLRHKGVVASSQRFYHLTKVMDSMHELVKQLHLYCLNTFLQSRALKVEFPEMMTEVISAQLPKILAGMVKPLVFHKK